MILSGHVNTWGKDDVIVQEKEEERNIETLLKEMEEQY